MSTRLVAVYPCDVARAGRDVVQEAGIVPIPRLCTAVAAQQQESDPAERLAAAGRATHDERCSMPAKSECMRFVHSRSHHLWLCSSETLDGCSDLGLIIHAG